MDEKIQTVLNSSLNDNLSFTTANNDITWAGTSSSAVNTTCWHYWTDWYYPQVIYREYPVYVREKAKDNARQAYEIIKILKDKKLVHLEKVGDFIDLMDELIKIL